MTVSDCKDVLQTERKYGARLKQQKQKQTDAVVCAHGIVAADVRDSQLVRVEVRRTVHVWSTRVTSRCVRAM